MKDHRQIGREQDLFSFHELAPGAIFWHPKGWIIYKILQDFIRQKTAEDGYLEISTPVMVKSQLFVQSGHWKHFGEHNMFNLIVDEESYSLKPMNCPEAALVFSAHTRSYTDLPIKLSEFGILHRRELSGVLGGAFRVRQFMIDDAHLFVRADQIQDEIRKLILLTANIYKSLAFKPKFYLATKPDKAMGDKKTWDEAERDLEKALKDTKVKFQLKPKDGAFYGPKIDIHIDDAQGRDWQLATTQLDFQIPQKMNLNYTTREGKKEKPVMIHQGIFGSFERFIAILTEHFQGAFPVWLAPIQIIVIPISDKNSKYARDVFEDLSKAGIRVELDIRAQTLQAKIRDATLQKIPYMVICGAAEEKVSKIALRTREGKDLGQMSQDSFLVKIKKETEGKTI